MDEVERISNQLEHAHREGAWVGVSARDVFRSLSAAEASLHPVPGAHSAWEIALHVTAWHDTVRRRLMGEVLDLTEDEDWPAPAEPTQASWVAALDELDRGYNALVGVVRELGSKELEELVPGKPFTVYVMLHGVTQHDLYHGGQVVMLRKTLRARP